MVIFAVVVIFAQSNYSQEAMKSTKVKDETVKSTEKSGIIGYQKVTLPIEDFENIDGQIERYLRDMWPIMSDNEI